MQASMGNEQTTSDGAQHGTGMLAAGRACLLVLGMHRAGTSALTRVLSLCGARLPRDLLPANEGNPSGYWEPRGVVELNEAILEHFGTAWDDPFAAFHIPAPGAIPARFHEQARAVLEREYADAALFALKDPRCTLLAEFWVDVLSQAGIACCPVVIGRHYSEVADSLRRRDGTPPAHAVAAYVVYGIEALDFGDRHGAAFLTYDGLLADWKGVVAAIGAKFGLEWSGDAAGAADIERFLVRENRPVPSQDLPPELQAWADGIWNGLRRRSEGGRPAEGDTAAIRDGLRRASELFSPVLVDRARRIRQLGEALEDAQRTQRALHAMFEESQATLKVAAEQRDRLQEDRNQLLARHHALETDRNQLAERHHELEADRNLLLEKHHELEADRERLLATLAALERDHQHSLAELDRAGSDNAALSAEVERLHAAIQEIYASSSWRLTAPLRAARRTASRLVEPRRRTRGPAPLPMPPGVDETIATPAGAGKAWRGRGELLAFLTAEFDASVAGQVVARIDRYRLPVDTTEVRSAASLDVAVDQAVAWAREIADAAARSEALGSDAPDVSIVVPVYNQVAFTLACIDALVAHRTALSFEILVGDDGSSDATVDALRIPIRGVRHVRHEQNLGFVRNCNATAALARGRYVVFLNNDTQVLPNWLDELVGVLERDPAIGLAGSKLVYPDGRMQECGAIVWKDGSAWNFGRFDDPRKPEYGYLRDVDYVSGASIALPAALWRQLGGFDEAFVPAYAEDADLAFRVRAAGLRTVVQPLSQLLHFEGISSGTDTSQGVKAHQVENLKKLRERWQHVLQGHRANADRPDLEKERGVTKRVLFIDHCTPTPNEDAGSLVAWEIMAAFQDCGYKVTFIPEDNFAHMGAATRDLQRIGIEPIYHPAYSLMPDFLKARRDPFDVVFMHRYKVGEAHLGAMRKYFPGAKIVFLNADMHFLRELREAEISGDPAAKAAARKTMERELAVVAGVDYALVHSDVELDILREQCPSTPATLFPLIHDPIVEPAPLARRDGICFVGGFRHPPNADGITWFVENGWSNVVAARPDARLYIVGSNMTPEVRALARHPGVEVVGFVDDLEGFLGRRRLSIAPLRYGAGAKGKVAASLANGLPAVCTPVAIEGMGLTPSENVVVGETADELAGQVIALLADDRRWQALAEAGLAYARDTTSRHHAGVRIRRVLEALGLGT